MTTTVEHRTVTGWLIDAGITADRARHHVESGHVFLDGVRVTDPEAELIGRAVELRVPAVPGRTED